MTASITRRDQQRAVAALAHGVGPVADEFVRRVVGTEIDRRSGAAAGAGGCAREAVAARQPASVDRFGRPRCGAGPGVAFGHAPVFTAGCSSTLGCGFFSEAKTSSSSDSGSEFAAYSFSIEAMASSSARFWRSATLGGGGGLMAASLAATVARAFS